MWPNSVQLTSGSYQVGLSTFTTYIYPRTLSFKQQTGGTDSCSFHDVGLKLMGIYQKFKVAQCWWRVTVADNVLWRNKWPEDNYQIQGQVIINKHILKTNSLQNKTTFLAASPEFQRWKMVICEVLRNSFCVEALSFFISFLNPRFVHFQVLHHENIICQVMSHISSRVSRCTPVGCWHCQSAWFEKVRRGLFVSMLIPLRVCVCMCVCCSLNAGADRDRMVSMVAERFKVSRGMSKQSQC